MSEESSEPSDGERGQAPAAEASPSEAFFTADRAKAFIDAVVAIAMTLLILPLLEAITSLAAEADPDGPPPSGRVWFDQNWMLLVSFLISFALIGMFWINHHRMFSRVHRVTSALLWINLAWLLTIVWLPVATAMTGVMDSNDPVVIVAYIGSMALTSLVALAQELFLQRHPQLHDIPREALLRGMAATLATTLLFIVSLIIALLVPLVTYFSLFLLVLTGPVSRVFARMFGVRRERRRA